MALQQPGPSFIDPQQQLLSGMCAEGYSIPSTCNTCTCTIDERSEYIRRSTHRYVGECWSRTEDTKIVQRVHALFRVLVLVAQLARLYMYLQYYKPENIMTPRWKLHSFYTPRRTTILIVIISHSAVSNSCHVTFTTSISGGI